MRICLVSAPAVSDFEDADATLQAHSSYTGTQLGILCLAATVRANGYDVTVIDLTQLYLDHLAGSAGTFEMQDVYRDSLEQILAADADVYGFSTLCSSYPNTIRLANDVSKVRDSLIVFGGPQASVVDCETLKHFPSVDLILRGEADHSFPQLLESIQDGQSVTDVLGLTYRSSGKRVIRNALSPLPLDLDNLPLPAFDLDPRIGERTSVHLEIGRGCPYACTFCSTNDFFRRNFRLKSTNTMIEHMDFLNEEYGISDFSLVHDMYTINRKKVIEFCEALVDHGRNYNWSCSARTDRVDDELLRTMADAGCQGIFFGIETGSERLQKIIGKKLDLRDAKKRIAAADSFKISAAVALICGFPEEERTDLRDTVNFYVDSLRHVHAEPQMSILAPLAKTPIEIKHKNDLIFDGVFSDMSHQGWRQDPADLELIKQHRDIFVNFYAVPSILPRAYVREVHDFVTGMDSWFEWLPVMLLDVTQDFLTVFEHWRTWHTGKFGENTERSLPYYCSGDFLEHSLDWAGELVQSCHLAASAREAAKAIVAYERILVEQLPEWQERGGVRESGVVTSSTAVVASPNARMIELNSQLPKLLSAIRRDEFSKNAEIADDQDRFVILRTSAEAFRVLQPNSDANLLISRCDGRTTIDQLIHEPPGKRKKQVAKQQFAQIVSLLREGILVTSEPDASQIALHA